VRRKKKDPIAPHVEFLYSDRFSEFLRKWNYAGIELGRATFLVGLLGGFLSFKHRQMPDSLLQVLQDEDSFVALATAARVFDFI
jgi:hypothetical protein